MNWVRLVSLMTVLAFIGAITGCQEGLNGQVNSGLKKKITYSSYSPSGLHVPQYTSNRSTDDDQK